MCFGFYHFQYVLWAVLTYLYAPVGHDCSRVSSSQSSTKIACCALTSADSTTSALDVRDRAPKLQLQGMRHHMKNQTICISHMQHFKCNLKQISNRYVLL